MSVGVRLDMRDLIKKNRLIIFLILIGGILRIHGLGQNSFWFDESIVLLEAQQPVPSLLGARAEGIHPPLFRFLLHFWMKLGSGEAFLRMLPVFFSIASIPLCFALIRKVLNESGAYVATAFMAFSPFQIYYAQEIKMYSLFLFLSLSSFYFFLKSLDGNKNIHWVGYAGCTVLALYTHYFAFWVILAENLVFLIYSRQLKKEQACVLKWLISQAVILILFFPWASFFFTHLGRVGDAFWTPPVISFAEILASFRNFTLGYYDAKLPVVPAAWFFLLLFFIGSAKTVAAMIKKDTDHGRRYACLLSLVTVCVPVVCVWGISRFFRSLYLERAFIFATCFYYGFLAQGVLALRKYVFFFRICVFVIVLALASGLYNTYRGTNFYPALGVKVKRPIREMFAYILSKYKADEPILLAHCCLVYPLYYYAPVHIKKNIFLVKTGREIEEGWSTLYGIERTFGTRVTDIEKAAGTSRGFWLICSGWDNDILQIEGEAKDWLSKQELVLENKTFPGLEVYYYKTRR
jgi:mannosyltransferase